LCPFVRRRPGNDVRRDRDKLGILKANHDFRTQDINFSDNISFKCELFSNRTGPWRRIDLFRDDQRDDKEEEQPNNKKIEELNLNFTNESYSTFADLFLVLFNFFGNHDDHLGSR